MRNIRIPVFVVAAVSGAVTVAFALLPGVSFASRVASLRAATATVAPILALVAGLLVLGRRRRGARLLGGLARESWSYWCSAPEAGVLADKWRIALAQIANWAVSNAARHSGAARVRLTLQRQCGRARLRVRDNGSGFDTAAQTDRYGLGSMRVRATPAGGLPVSSMPGRGTEVEVRL